MRLISLLPVIMLPLALTAPVPDTDTLTSASTALAVLNSSLASSLSSAEIAYLDSVIAAAAAVQNADSKSKRQGVAEEVENLLGLSTSTLGLTGVLKERNEKTKRQDALDALDLGTLLEPLSEGLGPVTNIIGGIPLSGIL
ncbi:hypothetical protein DID88_006105 [Monilinia fructigena]|uniref:Cell wall protein n=1 Tax=Monilinia fructigena TaxID=38457 RepID=A0A395J2U8_9HELO|nr:hypothetical protein DID88_006105 [Monilinia fructigena]